MNTKITGLLLAGAIIVSAGSFAQTKQFTIAEATNGMGTTLATKGVKGASWQPGTHNFWQVEKTEGKDVWTVADHASGKSVTVPAIETDGPKGKEYITPAIKWLDKNNAWFMKGKEVVLATLSKNMSWATAKMATLPEKAENVKVDKSRKIAYTIDNNLWLWTKEKGKVAVTRERNKNVVCGQSVHRDEFGIDGGIFFSPKGNYLAYYRMDQTMVKDYPIVKWNETPATVDLIKYPMAGGTSHHVTLCVYDPKTGKTVAMRTGTPKDHYLTCVTWSPDEKHIYIGILNRGQNHLTLNKYDAHSGMLVSTLFEESDREYVHPTHPLTFIPDMENRFLWWSERDGYEHLYLYSTTGKLIRQVTRGAWVVNELVGMDKEKGNIIITASKESPMEKHIYSVSLDNGSITRIDKGAGMHSALCSDDGKYVFDVYSGEGIPKNSVIRATDGTYEKMLVRSPDPLAEYDRPLVKNIELLADDGVTTLYGKLILPTNFNPQRKYPVIVYLYNGPNVQLLHNQFPESGNLWYEYMAQHGYVVFTMDGRGSKNRGIEFEQATFRRLGEVELRDQLRGVEFLKTLPYVDARRMGVHGWSYGGFMTTSLMLKHPGVFKCGVAGGPVMDWKMYEVMYTERYMDTPGENPDGYASTNLLDKVKNLKGKLLLIHGTQDNVVVWQHSINFLKKCVDEGVQADYFVYPGYEHNVRGKDRVHLMQKVSDYFDAYLKP